MTTVQSRPALEERARRMADDLMKVVWSDGEGWKPRKWKEIIAAVELAGDDAREANPYAALVYQRFVLIAHSYLVRYPNYLQRRRLVNRVDRDLISLEEHRKLMDVRAFDVHEELILNDFAKGMQQMLDEHIDQ